MGHHGRRHTAAITRRPPNTINTPRRPGGAATVVEKGRVRKECIYHTFAAADKHKCSSIRTRVRYVALPTPIEGSFYQFACA